MAQIEWSVCYLDGSGIPTTIRVGPLFFAFDLHGEVTYREISGRSVLRRERLRCTSIAQQAFRRHMEGLAAWWIEANRAMYADLLQD